MSFDDNEIKNLIPYPWSINIADLIVSTLKGYTNESDLMRYFEICHNTMDLILTEKENKITKKCGSEKLKLATTDFFKKVINEFNNAFNFLAVADYRIDYAVYSEPYNTCHILFTHKLSYAQKRKVYPYIKEKLLKHYQKWNPTLITLCGLNVSFYFNDGGMKTNPCNDFIIRTRANDWTAIGMDPNAEFVPRIGMKRNSI